MILSVHRHAGPPAAATIGTLAVDGVPLCFTLEDTVREVPGQPTAQWKLPGKTAVPRGTYKVALDWSPHFGCVMPHVLDVPGFDGIRIHVGNTPPDTDGCILVGFVDGTATGSIGRSRDAFNTLMPKLMAATKAGEAIGITID